jgi:N-methylhydantoinase B/oxoprolinase/acetone carboxylase alpha subunit
LKSVQRVSADVDCLDRVKIMTPGGGGYGTLSQVAGADGAQRVDAAHEAKITHFVANGGPKLRKEQQYSN